MDKYNSVKASKQNDTSFDISKIEEKFKNAIFTIFHSVIKEDNQSIYQTLLLLTISIFQLLYYIFLPMVRIY